MKRDRVNTKEKGNRKSKTKKGEQREMEEGALAGLGVGGGEVGGVMKRRRKEGNRVD